ncbi:hypothetical protein [Nocardia alni]|uniref:hypothetical protein n=1 Tax=Nocardia alni TaxID=2815723 RepID=UPI001C24390D|nr:hypothetical protein [Nocardia alni]
MVDVAAAIADLAARSPGGITVRMIHSQTRIPDGQVKQVVKRLVEAGLLLELPRNTPRAPLYHAIDYSGGSWVALVQTCRTFQTTTTDSQVAQ